MDMNKRKKYITAKGEQGCEGGGACWSYAGRPSRPATQMVTTAYRPSLAWADKDDAASDAEHRIEFLCGIHAGAKKRFARNNGYMYHAAPMPDNIKDVDALEYIKVVYGQWIRGEERQKQERLAAIIEAGPRLRAEHVAKNRDERAGIIANVTVEGDEYDRFFVRVNTNGQRWLTPARARTLADMLMEVADEAEVQTRMRVLDFGDGDFAESPGDAS